MSVQVNHGLSDKLKPGKVSTILCTVLTVCIAVSMIVMGSLYLNRCPAERFIPIYLIVGGSFSLFSIALGILGKCCENDEGKQPLPVKAFMILVGIFIIAWFIAGCFWIYSIHGKYSTNALMSNFCDESFYLFAFWMTTLMYIMMGILIFLLCCLCCCTMCCAAN